MVCSDLSQEVEEGEGSTDPSPSLPFTTNQSPPNHPNALRPRCRLSGWCLRAGNEPAWALREATRRRLPAWGWRLGRGCGGPVEPKQGSAHRRDDGGGFVRAGRARRVWRWRREEAHEDVTRVPTMSDAAAQATREAASAPGGHSRRRGRDSAAGAGRSRAMRPPAATTVDVVSYDIYFEPNEVTIPANTDVTVNLPNEGATPHNFSIDALGIDVDIAPGATEQVVINAPAGEYEYYCNVPGHKEAGMVGTLIVSEDAAAAPAGAATPAERAAPPAAPPSGGRSHPGRASAASRRGKAQTVDIVSYDIYFEPKEVTIPANTDVTFVIPNDGVAPHNFSIDELGIDIDIAPGETQETVINAPGWRVRVLLQRSWAQRGRDGWHVDRQRGRCGHGHRRPSGGAPPGHRLAASRGRPSRRGEEQAAGRRPVKRWRWSRRTSSSNRTS